MKTGLFISLSFLAGLLGKPCFAGQHEQMLQTQRLIEDRVNSIARIYDAHAFVILNLKFKKEKIELPGAPFYYEDFQVLDEDETKIEKIDAKLVMRLSALPSEAAQLIKESLQTFCSNVQVTFQQLPASSLSPQSVPEFRLSLPEGGGLSRLLFESPLALVFFTFLLMSLGGSAAALLLLAGRVRTGVGQVTNSLTQGLGGLKESLENGVAEKGSSGSSAIETSVNNEGAGESDLSAFSAQSCLELLADCYWCQRDDYAAFLWNRLSMAQRIACLAAWPALDPYVRHFQGIRAADYGFHSDVNYLTPLDLHLLDNRSLTEQVQAFPALLTRLSPLRSEALLIGVSERLELQKKARQNAALPVLASLKPSADRNFRGFAQLRVASESGEKEVLTLRNLPVEAKEQFITLAWMIQLPKEKVSEILDGFSARDLALAWVGPASLLAFLGECLSPKKRELVLSYASQIKPNRDSETYARLHRLAIEAFKEGATTPKIEPVSLAA